MESGKKILPTKIQNLNFFFREKSFLYYLFYKTEVC